MSTATLHTDSVSAPLGPITSHSFHSLLRLFNTFAFPFAFYFKPFVVLLAITWLIYRAYEVLNKPLDELANLLGFDIPATPVIDLANVKADGAIVHWSLPDKQKHKTSFRFEINVNGNPIETLSIQDTAATITGLHPGRYYVVRVALVNNVEFSSRSAPIRFRTKPASSADFFLQPADGNDTDQDLIPESLPRVRPFRGLKDITPPSPDVPSMAREASSGLAPKRSLTGARRPSPATLDLDRPNLPSDVNDPQEGADTIQLLTEKLDTIRRETDEVEKQAKEEEEEELRQKEELSKERDELKAEATEKERASRKKKNEVNTLERQNTAAQNERTKHERMLQQKKQDRQKLKDDMVRWDREAVEMKAAVERIHQDKADHLQRMELEKQALRDRQAEEAAAIKILDEEVREKNAEIKKMDRTMKNSSPNGSDPEPNLVQQHLQDAEERRLWDISYGQMQQQYAMTVQKLEQTKRMYAEQAAYLDSLRARRRQEEAAQYASPPSTQERVPRRGDSQRSRRAQSGHSSSESPHLAGFPISSGAFGPSMTSTSSMFSSAPFLNIHNGMTISGPTEDIMSDEDKEKLTGGAPMSPGAGAELLPADLFGDGDNKLSSNFIPVLPGLGSLPGLPGIPGPSAQLPEHPGPGPASPASGSSRSASVFASPQASQHNLAHIGSPENAIDADRRSIRSTRSNRATSGGGAGSRFSGMFGIKQRTKTVSSVDEGLSLGSAQSHSMPRQDGGIPGIDSATRKRNSSISGTMLTNSFGNDGAFDMPPPPAAASSSRRSRAFGFFSSNKDKADGWPSAFTGFGRRPASPRPVSTHSNELPRPSFDSSRWGVDTWPSSDAASGARSSPLAFNATPGWNPPQQSRMYGSRHPSRRPSQQYGSSGPPEDILEDEDSDVDPYRAKQLGAIGTRPPVSSKKAGKAVAVETDANKLNPNARDFKSLFTGIKLTGNKEKSRDSAPSTHSSSAIGTPNPERGDHYDESPPNSRKSKDTRDTYSMTTTESSIAESSRNSAELARTVSYTNSDAPAPSPLLTGSSIGKESFMQKLSRKSSSSKFSLPTFKREKSKLDTGAPTSVPAEDDEDLSASVSSMPRESKELPKDAGRGSGRNWSSVLKLGKAKKGNETPSVSGMSMTSGTEDNTEDEE